MNIKEEHIEYYNQLNPLFHKMMLNKLISIIIPTYNRAHLINDTLDSIIVQTYADWECIVVDDGSTDNTGLVLAEYVEQDSRIQYHIRPNTRAKGANSCRNYGFELCKGEYVNWFDSDDLLVENAFEIYIKSFQKKYTDVVVSPLKKVNFEMKELSTANIESEDLIKDYLVGKVAFFVSGPIWKRSFLNKQKFLFDEQLGNLDDWDFNLRMLYEKPNILFIKSPLIFYRVHQNSLSHELGKLNVNEINSEFKARLNHVDLLTSCNYLRELNVHKHHIINRYIYFLKQTLILRNINLMFNLLISYVRYSFKFRDLKVFKIISITMFCFISKRGYKWLK